MATTTKKQTATVADSGVTVEQGINDLQAQGEARFNEIAAAVAAEFGNIDTAKANIVGHLRTIRDESLWVFARNSAGEAYTDWKSAVKDLLNGNLSHWSDRARGAFVVMLIDEGFTVKQAAEVADVSPAKAATAVAEANDAAEGKTPEDTETVEPPAEVAKDKKAIKVSEQTIAQNKRQADALYDLPIEALKALSISVHTLDGQVTQMLKQRIAEVAGTESAA